MTRWKFLVPVTAAAVLFGAALLVHHVSTSVDRDGGDSHNHIDPLDLHDSPPQVVASNAISVILSWRPNSDTSSWDALHRAAPMLTGPLAAAAAAPPNPPPRPVQQWSAWAAANDTISASATVLGEPLIRGDTATVTVAATQTVLHPGGKTTPHRRAVLKVTLTRTANLWRVANYTEETR
ncbi:hypothetical protein [Nocardia asiatica]|uniref:hypothetical protein n=1 Tax=Nocardia asiatica TaxID=209252 RepID=UPI000302D9A5|nr:hypothetical protein [Nocardia asiatica]